MLDAVALREHGDQCRFRAQLEGSFTLALGREAVAAHADHDLAQITELSEVHRGRAVPDVHV
ncbi:MAG: hypothetical protein H6716_17510 [Polyangiaceae bacterium]|nr:hypothetical protein [Polyangiaceae bacterium]